MVAITADMPPAIAMMEYAHGLWVISGENGFMRAK
jgi:hypothetical protein